MGYRSDVKIVFYLTKEPHDTPPTDTNPILSFAALKLWFDETYPVSEAKEWDATIDYGEDYILTTYQDVKWYPSYEHVIAVEATLEKFSAAFRSDERDHRGSYEFVRTGESEDDVEADRSSYADYRLNVARDIIFE